MSVIYSRQSFIVVMSVIYSRHVLSYSSYVKYVLSSFIVANRTCMYIFVMLYGTRLGLASAVRWRESRD